MREELYLDYDINNDDEYDEGHYTRIKGHETLFKDSQSGAVISANYDEYQAYLSAKLAKERELEKTDSIQSQLDNLKRQITEMKKQIEELQNESR
jgi:hypothetical protein